MGFVVLGPNTLSFPSACGDALSSKWGYGEGKRSVRSVEWGRGSRLISTWLGNGGLVGLTLLGERMSGACWIGEWESGSRLISTWLGNGGLVGLTLLGEIMSGACWIGLAIELGESFSEVTLIVVGGVGAAIEVGILCGSCWTGIGKANTRQSWTGIGRTYQYSCWCICWWYGQEFCLKAELSLVWWCSGVGPPIAQ
ncbi:hypothetical protein ACSQ67_001131 [Phaseolus vulgaris]